MAKSETRGNAKAKAAISRHPLFPAMVALWCAALLSLGSLAIGTVALENLVLALRIDLVLPIAAPPLGIKARILLALALFIIGAVFGFMLARRIARPRDTIAPRNFQQGRGTDSSDADADQGEDFARLNAAATSQIANPIPGRRRALAMEEDYTREFHEHMPLPGGAPQILDLAELGAFSEISEADEVDGADGADEPAANGPVAAEEPAESHQVYDPWNRHTERPLVPAQQADAPSMIALAPAVPPAGEARPFAAPSANPISAFAPPAEVADDGPLQTPFGGVFSEPETATNQVEAFATGAPEIEPELVDAGSALRAFAAPAAPAAIAPQPEPAIVVAVAAAAPISAVLGLVPSDAAEKLMTAPIASLGVVELAERLALAISRRRGTTDAAPALETTPTAPAPVQQFAMPNAFAQPVEHDATPRFEPRFAVPLAFAPPSPPVAADPIASIASAQPSAQPATQPSALPSAMRPLSFDDTDDDSLESVLPPRLFGKPAQVETGAGQAFAAPPVVEQSAPPSVDSSDGANEESFGSLLGMKPTLRETFVRVEEPVDEGAPVEPVVVFPGQAARTAPFDEASIRRFDSPGAMAPGNAPSAPTTTNPQETERALKAALATLQRMSGAA